MEDVSLNAGCQEDPICIADDRVVFKEVACIRRRDKADSKIVPRSRIAVSTEPVRTEPVAAGAAAKSYTATGRGGTSVSYRDVVLQQMAGPTDQDDA